MKKITLKALLMAAALGMGGNAWAEDVYETVYTRAAVSDWVSTDVADWGGSSNGLTVDADHGLFFNPTNPSAAYSATKTFTIEANAKVKYEVSWYTGSSTGRESNYEYIQFGDKIRLSWNSKYWFYLDKNGTSTSTTTIGQQGGNTTYTKSISIIFDTSKKKVDSFVFDGIDLTSQVSGSIDGKFNILTFGLQRGGSTANWGYPNGLVTLTVSQCKQTVSTVNYTINYKLGNAVVKTVSSSTVVGSVISSDTAVDGEGDYVGNHYLITAENAPSMTLDSDAANNVLNVPVRAPYTATLNVTTTIGTGEPTLVTTNLVETDAKVCAWSYAYPLYVKSGDTYYKADNTTTFGEGGTFTNGEVINKSVTYSTADENVVFFTDNNNTGGTNYTYSNGNTSFVGAQNARGGSGAIRGIGLIDLPAGEYEFITYFTARNGRGLVIRDNDNATDPIFGLYTEKNDASTGGLRSGNFSVNAKTTCVINGANSGTAKTNQSEDFDYILIKKLPTTVSKTISAAGYATYYSPYALDFSSVEGLTAYVATVDGDNVSFTEVDKVPANTGVLLKGAAGTYDIPVTADGGSATSAMVGVTVNTDVPAGIFVLLDGEEGVGFYETKNTFTVGANTAYIPASGTEGSGQDAKRRFIAIENDDATAITAIEAADAIQNGVIYNLSGQRVVKPLKGIYIQNGKKILVK